MEVSVVRFLESPKVDGCKFFGESKLNTKGKRTINIRFRDKNVSTRHMHTNWHFEKVNQSSNHTPDFTATS